MLGCKGIISIVGMEIGFQSVFKFIIYASKFSKQLIDFNLFYLNLYFN